jgi:hypothetical protein
MMRGEQPGSEISLLGLYLVKQKRDRSVKIQKWPESAKPI